MPRRHAPLYLALVFLLALLFLVFMQQWRKTKTIIVEASPRPLLSALSLDIPVTASDPIMGNPGAPITLIEFIDLGDKDSRRRHAELAAFVKKNPQKMRLVWKDYPRAHFFSNSKLAHRALWCAGERGKFWQLQAAVLATTGYSETTLTAEATRQKLDAAQFTTCLNSAPALQAQEASAALVKALGLPKPPVIFINNKLLNYSSDLNLTDLLTSLIAE